MAKMTIALLQVVPTRLTGGGLVRNTHTRVKRAMGYYCSVMLEVEKFSVRDLHHGLTDNVIIRPKRRRNLSIMSIVSEAQLNFYDDMRAHTVHQT